MQLSTKHLLGIKDISASDISLILSTARQFKEVLQRPVKKVPSLREVTIVNLFYENSTRTRISFELAEKRRVRDEADRRFRSHPVEAYVLFFREFVTNAPVNVDQRLGDFPPILPLVFQGGEAKSKSCYVIGNGKLRRSG